MKSQRSKISEPLLNLSLVKSSDAIVRELALACKKVGIYGPLHPVAERALEKLFLAFMEIFKAKKLVTFNLDSGRLHVMSMRIRDSIFTDDVTRFFQALEVRAVCVSDNLDHKDLAAFVERLVKREKKTPHSSFIPDYLRSKHITSIEVNSELAYCLFEQNLNFRSDIDRDFTVRQVAMEQLSGDLIRLAEIYDADDNVLKSQSIDFNNVIIQYLLPEKVSSFNAAAIVSQVDKYFAKQDAAGDKERLTVKQQKQLGRLLSLHPERSSIINSLHFNHGGQVAALIRESVLPSVESFPDDTIYAMADYETQFFTLKEADAPAFADFFQRNYRTGRRGQTIEIVDYLVKQLSMPEWHLRQKALLFINECLRNVDPLTDKFVLENLIVRLSQIVEANAENFEHAELISTVLELCCRGQRFQIMIELIDSMAKRRTTVEGVAVFDSMAIKTALMKLNRPELLNYLIDELAVSNANSAKIIQRILIAVGSEEVAQSLVKIISHPSRQLRQIVLKTLTELGRPALTICAGVLVNNQNFERPEDRSELLDYKWYVIRNAIYVLGALKSPSALESLRNRMNDPDIRVRREIITALEKIGGEEACDLLLLMAEDHALEIRELALNKLSQIGTPDSVPLVIDLMQRVPQLCVKCVQTIGQLGGEPSNTFLQLLLQDEHKADDLTRDCIPKEEFKAAIVRALARFGDPQSLDSIKKYNKGLTNTQKLMIKNTPLDSALNEVLNPKK